MTTHPQLDWRRVERRRAHELVIEAIEEQIMTGALKVGDALPPERELSARLGVSRAGVREAVRVLEGQGVLRTQPGAGEEAGTFIDALPRAALIRFLRLHVALSNFTLAEITDTRVVLERDSAARAATRADPTGLAAIEVALLRMEDPAVTRAEFNDADSDFHVAIAEASGSNLSAALMAAIRVALRAPILRGLEPVPDWPTVARERQAEHRAIFEAIQEGAAQRAADLVERHIREASVTLIEAG